MKNRYISIALFLYLVAFATGQLAQSQVKTSVSYSNPWLIKIKEINEDRKELKQALKAQKKKGEEEYHGARDAIAGAIPDITNIPNIPAEDLLIIATLEHSKKGYQSIVDSLILEADVLGINHDNSLALYTAKVDSCQKALNAYSQQYFGDISSTLPQDSLLIPSISLDSSLAAKATRDSLIQKRLEAYLTTYVYQVDAINELTRQESSFLADQKRLMSYQADFNKYRDKKNLKSNLEKLSQSELIENNKTLSNAHQQLAENKRKYLTLPSSSNLEQGIKQNSLEHLSFWERFKIGGNLRISQRKYLDIDFSPSVAYMVNKKWSLGSEFVMRSQFGDGRRWYQSFGSDTYGGRVFADYAVIKSFFAHAEVEQIYKPLLPVSEDQQLQQIPGALAGLGKTFDLRKNIKGKIIVQYNFIYDETKAVYPGPWVVRFGFDITKKAKEDKVKD